MDSEKTKKILIIAPHPDDEVLGCGGIIKRYVTEGHDVYVSIVTRGSPKRYSDKRITMGREQALKAHSLLGVKETFFYDFPASELDLTSRADIADALCALITKLRIEIIYIPHRGDINNDHAVVFNAAMVAARPIKDCPVKSIYVYETLSSTEWASTYVNDAFIPDRFIDIEQYFQFKLEAMSCYSGQLKLYPNPRSLESIEALAKYRGSAIGLKRAEAFMTVRTIE